MAATSVSLLLLSSSVHGIGTFPALHICRNRSLSNPPTCLAQGHSNNGSSQSSPSSIKWAKPIAASPSNGQKTPPGNGFLPVEDGGYLIKLSLSCVTGAAAIKYGSILLPGITRPNLIEALLMIGLPVLVGVAMLIAASVSQEGSRHS